MKDEEVLWKLLRVGPIKGCNIMAGEGVFGIGPRRDRERDLGKGVLQIYPVFIFMMDLPIDHSL